MTADLSHRLRTLGEAGDVPTPPIDDLIQRGRRKVRTRRLTGTGAAVLTVAVVASALAFAGREPAMPSVPTAAASSAGPVSLALAAQTSESTSYLVTMTVRYNRDDIPPLTFEAGYDPATGNAFIRDVGNLKFTEERQIGSGCWVRTSGEWQRVEEGCFKAGAGTKAGYLRDPKGMLDELKSAGDAKYAGRSNGVDTWTFTAVEKRETATLRHTGTVKVDVATSRVLSVESTESLSGETVTSTITASYHDYGKPVVVENP